VYIRFIFAQCQVLFRYGKLELISVVLGITLQYEAMTGSGELFLLSSERTAVSTQEPSGESKCPRLD
jgi:hypothetical protein